MAIGGFVDKHSLPKEELPKLSSILSSKYGNNTAYGDVVYTADYEYTVIYRGVEDFDIIEYHLIDNNKNKKITNKEKEGFRGSLNRASSIDEITKGEYPSDNYHVTDGETTRNNAGLDSQASQGESQQTSNNASSKKHQGWVAIKRDSATGRIALIENGNIKDQESFDKWAKPYLNKQRSDYSNSIVAEIRGTNGNNDNLYSRSQEGESFGGESVTSGQNDFGTGFIRVYDNDGTKGSRYIPINDYFTQTYTTPQGEIYGFVDKKGDMYIDETIATPNHYIP